MFSLRVFVTLGKTEIDNVNIVLGALVAANQEIVGLDISVDDSLFVHFLNTVDLQNSHNSKAENYELEGHRLETGSLSYPIVVERVLTI